MSFKPFSLAYTVKPNLTAIRAQRSTLTLLLKEMNVPEKYRQSLLLASSEWMNNLVIHTDPMPDKLTLILTTERQKAMITIKDNGSSFPEFADYLQSEVDITGNETTLPKRGYGLFLMNSLCSQLVYTAKETSEFNYLTMSVIYPL